MTLGILADKMDMIRGVGSFRKMGNQSYHSGARPYGDVLPGLAMHEVDVDFADEPLVCIDLELMEGPQNLMRDLLNDHPWIHEQPNVAFCKWLPNRNHQLMRFEFTHDYGSRHSQNLLNLWSNMDAFFKGELPEETMWDLHSYYLGPLSVQPAIALTGKVLRVSYVSFTSITGTFFSEHNKGYTLWNHISPEMDITPESLMDALKLACYIKERQGNQFYSPGGGAPMPALTSIEDIPRIRNYLRNVAESINKQFERLIIARLPSTVVDNFRPGGTQTLYPEHKGRSLDQLLAIDRALQSIATGALDMSRTLVAVSDIFQFLYLNKSKLDAHRAINDLQTARNVLADVAAGLSATTGAAKATDPRGYIAAGLFAIMAGLDIAIGSLNDQIIDIDEAMLYKESMRQIRDQLRALQTAAENIGRAFSDLQSAASHLEQNGLQAASRFAFALGLDGSEAGHVFHSNTVMRRRYNTLRERYETAFLRAKKLGFIARRAIEFRLGVDLGEMNKDMILVPKPSSWADRICTMQGFDYRRLRNADPDDPLFDPELQASDSYANWYVGDYVRMLSDFVESYNLDFPFTDDRDLAVLSLKNDIMRARSTCMKESYNLLAFSDAVGRQEPVTKNGVTVFSGWSVGGCGVEMVTGCDPALEECEITDFCVDRVVHDASSATCEESFCFGYDESWIKDPDNPTYPEIPAEGARISDRVPAVVDGEIGNGRLDQWENSGYLTQSAGHLPSGWYVMSLWVRDASELTPAVPFLVEVLQDGVVLPDASFEEMPLSGWQRYSFGFYAPATGEIEVRIHPSAAMSGAEDANPEFGDIHVWGAQLEYVPPGSGRCVGEACVNVDPLPLDRTDGTRLVKSTDCEDQDGAEMRKRFTFRCMCVDKPNGQCTQADLGSPFQKCFWEYPFTLTLEAVESSAAIPSNNISIGNFNYRHESLAANVVGTNVIDCSRTSSPSTCYTNAFLNYTFEQRGEVEVRNHMRDTQTFSMPAARVEHGKALTAEVVLTNPLMSTHSTLLNDYWKSSLKGRPLQGQYYLRIWDTPGLAWNLVEDIQLVWRYRYWTSMGDSY